MTEQSVAATDSASSSVVFQSQILTYLPAPSGKMAKSALARGYATTTASVPAMLDLLECPAKHPTLDQSLFLKAALKTMEAVHTFALTIIVLFNAPVGLAIPWQGMTRIAMISMNARQATEAVNIHVPTHQGYESVAAGLGSDQLVMADVKRL